MPGGETMPSAHDGEDEHQDPAGRRGNDDLRMFQTPVRRTRSFEHLRPGAHVTKEQEDVFDTAYSNLTRAQKERIENRKIKMNRKRSDIRITESDVNRKGKHKRSPSRQKRHSEERRDKWKKKEKKHRKEKKDEKRKQQREEKHSNRAPSEEIINLIRGATGKTRAQASENANNDNSGTKNYGLKPSEQIEKNNYINNAFARLRKATEAGGKYTHSDSDGGERDGGNGGSDSSDSSDDSSSDSSTDSDSGIETNTSSTQGRGRSSRQSRGRRNRKSSKRSHKKQKTYKAKRVPPDVYDGRPHLPTLHRFMSESAMWIEDAEIPQDRQVYRISRFLKGEAYNFYARQVSHRVGEFDLERFFYKLYDHCFPVDFKERQQTKLERFDQRNLTVREYLARLDELFLATGTEAERERKRYFWNGLRNEIQVELRKKGVSDGTSQYEEIIQEAERVELAIQLSRVDRERRQGNGNGSGPRRGNQNNTRRSENRSRDRNESRNGYRRDRNHRGQYHGRRTNGRPSSRSRQSGQTHTSRSNQSSNRANNSRNNQDRPKRSEKELEQLRAAGKCFICEESGHMARGCPKANTMTGARRPGVQNFNIEVSREEIRDIEDQRALAETTEEINTISLEVMDWAPYSDEEDSESRSDACGDDVAPCVTQEPLAPELGDPVLRRLQWILPSHAPYPTDNIRTAFEPDRFDVYRCVDGYCITDSEADEEQILLPFKAAYNPHFDVVWWYSKALARYHDVKLGRFDLMKFRAQNSARSTRMGSILSQTIDFQLSSWELYPAEAPEGAGERFCTTFDLKNRDGFVIEDWGLEFNAKVPYSRLTPKCNIRELYSKHLKRAYQKLCTILSEIPESENELWLLDHEPSEHEISVSSLNQKPQISNLIRK
ncbi:hypothetical protein D9611_010081 [Ephemerocybe angulata]|uniref:CCHC-type domain-containing protein n=1 Tax=Ephemerocybe angulata TaxID=980116 RepID=A0A8H5EV80_9AGAR|nr:hypothetical protein D9611_010081 [Tulosesus angulatus]